jgi:hypothetical protein
VLQQLLPVKKLWPLKMYHCLASLERLALTKKYVC